MSDVMRGKPDQPVLDPYRTFHVGVNVFVIRDGKLLMGKRKNVYGEGTWGVLGGHLENGELMRDAAARELKEETGMTAESFEFSNVVNDRTGIEHRLQFGFVARGVTGEPVLKEPDRCEAWEWFGLDALPDEIFRVHIRQIENLLQDRRFFDD